MRNSIRVAGISLLLFVIATACTDGGNGSQIQSGTVLASSSTSVLASTTSAAPPSTTTSPSSSAAAPSAESTTSTTTELAVASAVAESYKILAPTIAELGQGVYDFVAVTEANRIDQLADRACSDTSPDMNDSELGLQGLAAYDELSAEERTSIALGDWVVFYGSLLGYFCPENLGQGNAASAPSPEGTELEQFQAVVSQLDGVSSETDAFAETIDDTRLTDLRSVACPAPESGSASEPESGVSNEEFGLAIVTSYETDLTEVERDQLSLSGYSELYGAVVGWFCPNNLPL
ncbi:MAG: hypothetical protein ACRBK7_03055 [Acidimicrobiales bacterium]